MHSLREIGILTCRDVNNGINAFSLGGSIHLSKPSVEEIFERNGYLSRREIREGMERGVEISTWPEAQRYAEYARDTLLVKLPSGQPFSVNVGDDHYFIPIGREKRRLNERRKRLAILPTDGKVPYSALPYEAQFMEDLKSGAHLVYVHDIDYLVAARKDAGVNLGIPVNRFHEITRTDELRFFSTLIIPILYGISMDVIKWSDENPQGKLDMARAIADDPVRAKDYFPFSATN